MKGDTRRLDYSACGFRVSGGIEDAVWVSGFRIWS